MYPVVHGCILLLLSERNCLSLPFDTSCWAPGNLTSDEPVIPFYFICLMHHQHGCEILNDQLVHVGHLISARSTFHPKSLGWQEGGALSSLACSSDSWLLRFWFLNTHWPVIIMKSSCINGKPFDWSIISRRSCFRAGVRYYVRGNNTLLSTT